MWFKLWKTNLRYGYIFGFCLLAYSTSATYNVICTKLKVSTYIAKIQKFLQYIKTNWEYCYWIRFHIGKFFSWTKKQFVGGVHNGVHLFKEDALEMISLKLSIYYCVTKKLRDHIIMILSNYASKLFACLVSSFIAQFEQFPKLRY